MIILEYAWVSMSDISLLFELTCWIFLGFTMRMRLFLIFHLERCFEKFQHRTAYFMKTDLLFSLDRYFGYTRLCSCSANEKCVDFTQFLTLYCDSGHYPWTMWPRKRICFANLKFDAWLLSYQNIKLHSSSISMSDSFFKVAYLKNPRTRLLKKIALKILQFDEIFLSWRNLQSENTL